MNILQRLIVHYERVNLWHVTCILILFLSEQERKTIKTTIILALLMSPIPVPHPPDSGHGVFPFAWDSGEERRNSKIEEDRKKEQWCCKGNQSSGHVYEMGNNIGR